MEAQLSNSPTYTMRDLNQRTAEVIREINESGTPAAITRHGRFIALITPLANVDVESAVLDAVIEAARGSAKLPDQNYVEKDLMTADELADELGITLPDQ